MFVFYEQLVCTKQAYQWLSSGLRIDTKTETKRSATETWAQIRFSSRIFDCENVSALRCNRGKNC